MKPSNKLCIAWKYNISSIINQYYKETNTINAIKNWIPSLKHQIMAAYHDTTYNDTLSRYVLQKQFTVQIEQVSNQMATVELLLLLLASVPATRGADELFELSVIHFNDFHARQVIDTVQMFFFFNLLITENLSCRFEEQTTGSVTCYDSEECIGGIARLYAAIKGLLEEKPDSVFLNAGDNFQGTLWYNVFKWNVTQHFLNLLPVDAMVS